MQGRQDLHIGFIFCVAHGRNADPEHLHARAIEYIEEFINLGLIGRSPFRRVEDQPEIAFTDGLAVICAEKNHDGIKLLAFHDLGKARGPVIDFRAGNPRGFLKAVDDFKARFGFGHAAEARAKAACQGIADDQNAVGVINGLGYHLFGGLRAHDGRIFRRLGLQPKCWQDTGLVKQWRGAATWWPF